MLLFLFITTLYVLAPISTTRADHPQISPTQSVRGRILDAVTHEPLPGANIAVLGTEPLIGASADQHGWFEIEGVTLGRHSFKVTFLGYKPTILSEIMVSSGNETVLTIRMEQQILEQKGVIVTPTLNKDRPQNEMAFVSTRTFSVEETRRYAGGLDDPGRMASAFAGVTSAGGVQNNALVIRGNAPKSIQWRLQGVEIPNPNHFAGLSVAGGGGLTLFSGRLLADSDFMTSAFPAQYRNALSGIFDVQFRSGNPVNSEHSLQIGLNGIKVASEGPVQKRCLNVFV